MSKTHWPPGGLTEGPVIRLKPDQGPMIIMPCPGNIIWTDTHGYTGVNLSESLIGKVRAGGAAALDNNSDQSLHERLLNANIAKRLAVGGAFGSTAQTAALALDGSDQPPGAIVNPQTRTLFTGSNVRTFQFDFDLVPRTAAEMGNVHEIHNTIREYSYPEAAEDTNNMILNFPAVWTIGFNAIGFNRIANTPVIMPCFLTNFTTTYNGSTSIWREDGNPVEIKLSVSFTETRPPLRGDI